MHRSFNLFYWGEFINVAPVSVVKKANIHHLTDNKDESKQKKI